MTLHWSIAALLVVMFVMGWYMADLPKGSERSEFFALHKSLGITVFLLAILRLGWRLAHRPPALPAALPPWQHRLAHTTHWMFYGLLLVHPVLGYLSSSFSGYPTRYFDVLKLPEWGWKDVALNALFSNLHSVTASLFALLIAIHVSAALWHTRSPEGNVLTRMLP